MTIAKVGRFGSGPDLIFHTLILWTVIVIVWAFLSLVYDIMSSESHAI